MSYVGIDYDTHAVHLVKFGDDGRATYHPCPLEGHDAFERTRKVRDVLYTRSSSFWDDVVAVGIEEPAGRLPGRLFRVQGAILACIPSSTLVEKLMPSQWRKAVGLNGNAPKETVSVFVASFSSSEHWYVDWPQDACDAYCLALAVSHLVETVAA